MPVDTHPVRNTALLTSHTPTQRHTTQAHTNIPHTITSSYVLSCPKCFAGAKLRRPDVSRVG